MKNSMNGTVLEPSGIIAGDVVKSRKYERVHTSSKTNIIEKHNILKEKELLFMLSMSIIWFFAFFYFVLYVFT